MHEYHDPSWLVQRAWSAFRLPALHELIESTIADLERLEPRAGVAAGSSAAGAYRRGDPVHEALRACIEELREASGMANAAEHRAAHCERVRYYMSQEPTTWTEAFGMALEEYRHAASSSLQRSFAAPPTTV